MNKIQKELVKGICEYQNFISTEEIKEVIKAIKESNDIKNDDFYIECNGVEIRIIYIDSVESIWEEGLEELLKDCYTIPDFLANYIDYDAWVKDCKFDGMGHYFSGYNGSEHESKNYHYFRTN